MLAGGEQGHTNAGGSQPEVMKRNAQSISGGLGSQCVGEEAERDASPPSPPQLPPRPSATSVALTRSGAVKRSAGGTPASLFPR